MATPPGYIMYYEIYRIEADNLVVDWSDIEIRGIIKELVPHAYSLTVHCHRNHYASLPLSRSLSRSLAISLCHTLIRWSLLALCGDDECFFLLLQLARARHLRPGVCVGQLGLVVYQSVYFVYFVSFVTW